MFRASRIMVMMAALASMMAAATRPNILVLMGDDWSWPHAGALGDPVAKTPTFDRLARDHRDSPLAKQAAKEAVRLRGK